MSRHAHKWEIGSTGFDHSARVFNVYWVCTQGRCTGTKTVELKPVRKPSKDARTDEEVYERRAEQKSAMDIKQQCRNAMAATDPDSLTREESARLLDVLGLNG